MELNKETEKRAQKNFRLRRTSQNSGPLTLVGQVGALVTPFVFRFTA